MDWMTTVLSAHLKAPINNASNHPLIWQGLYIARCCTYRPPYWTILNLKFIPTTPSFIPFLCLGKVEIKINDIRPSDPIQYTRPSGNLSFWQWNHESPVSATTAVLPETFSVCVERVYNLAYVWEDAPPVVFICSCIPVKPFGKCGKRKSSIGTDPKAGPWASTALSGCTMIGFYVSRRSEYPTEL